MSSTRRGSVFNSQQFYQRNRTKTARFQTIFTKQLYITCHILDTHGLFVYTVTHTGMARTNIFNTKYIIFTQNIFMISSVNLIWCVSVYRRVYSGITHSSTHLQFGIWKWSFTFGLWRTHTQRQRQQNVFRHRFTYTIVVVRAHHIYKLRYTFTQYHHWY